MAEASLYRCQRGERRARGNPGGAATFVLQLLSVRCRSDHSDSIQFSERD